MTTRMNKIIKKDVRRALATKILRGDLSDPVVKEIIQGAPSHATRIGYSGKPNTAGFSPSFGTTNRESGGPNGYIGSKRLVINSFTNAPSSKSKVKTKKTQTVNQRMTRAWAENLAGRWLNANRRDDTPYTGVC